MYVRLGVKYAIYAKLEEMNRSGNLELAKTASIIERYVPKRIVRVKLNVLDPQGINRWNTFKPYVLRSRGKQ